MASETQRSKDAERAIAVLEEWLLRDVKSLVHNDNTEASIVRVIQNLRYQEAAGQFEENR